MAVLGLNEALILAAVSTGESTIATIVERIEATNARSLSEGTIYVALQRMGTRGFIRRRQARAKDSQGRSREIGYYEISNAGQAALVEFERDSTAIRTLRVGTPAHG